MRRTSARLLCLILVLTLVFTTVAPALAATYRNGAQSGPSSSYKGGKYYANYLRVPITGDNRTDIVHYMWRGMFQGEYCGTDIAKANRQKGNKALNEDRIHPTQKPVALYAWILQKYATEGATIFDPMMGSQSSRIAAYKLGYDYVGCELDKEYFDTGCERFNKECKGEIVMADGSIVKQCSLFNLTPDP